MAVNMNFYIRAWDNDNRKWIYFHRLLAEYKYNRKIEKHESVHHIDNNHLNNRLSNLVILTKADHLKIHTAGLDRSKYKKRQYKKRNNWALHYDKCIICGTTEIIHHGKGKCKKCYDKEFGKVYYKEYYKNKKLERLLSL